MSSQISEENQITYDQIIEHLADNPALPSLTQHQLRDLFQQTEYIPYQLTYNLKSDNRIIRKIEAGYELSHTIFRGFYFQLLKLCYQMYDEQSSKNYIQILKSIVLDNALLENQQSQKYLKYIAQFFILMENGQEQDYALFEQILAEYHEIDQAFIHIFSFILQTQSHLEQDSGIETILNQLCDFFQIGLISNHPFYQFEQSEIYLFIQDEKAVYLVYQQAEEISHLSSSKRSEQRSEQRGNSNLSKPQSNNGQSQVIEVEQIHKESKSNNQTPLTQRKQVVELTFQQRIQQLSRPLSKASVKSNKNKQQEGFRKQEENRLFINKPNNPFSTTYASPSSHNSYFTPIKDIQSNQPSNQRRVEQTPVQYAINSYYDGLYGDIPHNTSTHLSSSKNDTIMNIFGELLKSVKFQNSMAEDVTKGKKNTTERTQKILESHQQFEQQSPSDLIPTFKKINKVDMTHMMDRAKSVKSVNEHISELNSGSIIVSKINEQNLISAQPVNSNKQIPSLDSNNQKITDKPLAKLQDNYKIFENVYQQREVANFDDDDTIFYKPKKSQLKVISEVTASKQTITHRTSDKLDDSNGSIYRQFSDTRILKLLKQPYKTKVQLMRNRFKGQHFNL